MLCARLQCKVSKLQEKYSKNTNLSCLRLTANYSSKEAADEEEPELDLSTVPSLDEHIMIDDVSLPLPGYVARRGAPGPPQPPQPPSNSR